MARRVIDTTVLVTLERRGWGLSMLRPSLEPDDEIAIAAVTISELLVGVYRADSEARRLRREVFLDTLLDGVPILPFDTLVAKTYGRVWAELGSQGRIIDVHDAQIAAAALTHGCDVLTENVKDFARVPGLAVSGPRWP